MMRDYIDRNILCIGRLCKEYCKWGYATPQMEKMSDIPFDLLLKVNCLTMPRQKWTSWDEAVSEIQEVLLHDYVIFCDEKKKIVYIDGYEDGNEETHDGIDFYVWSLVQYIYFFRDKDRIFRARFLWVSIFLPYFYKLSQYGKATIDELRNMLIDHPIINGKDATEETLKMMREWDYPKQKAYFNNEFSKIIGSIEGMDCLLPSQGNIATALEDAKAGLAVAIHITKA